MAMQMDPTLQGLVSEGKEAWENIKLQETWANWVIIGKTIDAGKTAMLLYLRINKPNGRVWSDNFGSWLRDTGFDKIDQTVRSRLQSCMENLEAIEQWRFSIGTVKAQEWQHPTAVWQKFKLATKMQKNPAEEPKKKGMDALTSAIDRLDNIAERIEPREPLVLDLSPDYLKSSVEAFIDIYGEGDSELFSAALVAILKQKKARKTKTPNGLHSVA